MADFISIIFYSSSVHVILANGFCCTTQHSIVECMYYQSTGYRHILLYSRFILTSNINPKPKTPDHAISPSVTLQTVFMADFTSIKFSPSSGHVLLRTCSGCVVQHSIVKHMHCHPTGYRNIALQLIHLED